MYTVARKAIFTTGSSVIPTSELIKIASKEEAKFFLCFFLFYSLVFAQKKSKSGKAKKDLEGVGRCEAFPGNISHLICDVSFTHVYAPRETTNACFIYFPTQSCATIKTPSLNLNITRDFSPNEVFLWRTRCSARKWMKQYGKCTSRKDCARRLEVSKQRNRRRRRKSWKAMARKKNQKR